MFNKGTFGLLFSIVILLQSTPATAVTINTHENNTHENKSWLGRFIQGLKYYTHSAPCSQENKKTFQKAILLASIGIAGSIMCYTHRKSIQLFLQRSMEPKRSFEPKCKECEARNLETDQKRLYRSILSCYPNSCLTLLSEGVNPNYYVREEPYKNIHLLWVAISTYGDISEHNKRKDMETIISTLLKNGADPNMYRRSGNREINPNTTPDTIYNRAVECSHFEILPLEVRQQILQKIPTNLR